MHNLMRSFLPILAISLVSIIGCSTTQNYYIDPVYSENKVQAEVLVLPLQQNWFEGNYSHTFGSLSGTAETTFYNSLEPLISENVYSRIRVIDQEQTFDGKMFQPAKLKMGKDSVNVLMPANQASFNLSDYDPEIVLVLDQYYFRKRERTIGGSSYAGHEEGKPVTELYFETKYIYWDTNKHEAIAWGNTNSSLTLSSPADVGSSDYYQVLSDAMEKMATQGPLL